MIRSWWFTVTWLLFEVLWNLPNSRLRRRVRWQICSAFCTVPDSPKFSLAQEWGNVSQTKRRRIPNFRDRTLLLLICAFHHIKYIQLKFNNSVRLRLKCDGTCAETRYGLSAKRTSPFKSAGASVQSTTDSRGVRISVSNAGYTKFRCSVKSTGYPLYFASCPFTSHPVRQRVPSDFNWTLNTFLSCPLTWPGKTVTTKEQNMQLNITLTSTECIFISN
jgi:hypothetical protein